MGLQTVALPLLLGHRVQPRFVQPSLCARDRSLVPIAFVVQPAILDPVGPPFAATVAFLRIGAALWLVSAAVSGGKDGLARSWLRLMALVVCIALLLVRLV